ncbi:beta-lactamase family protein [Kordiimonas sp. SCSIO 12603]|uniref:serine hydrolase domain-containing protein n=1 Tax=Kordiimonas sp. SCSIO 12603 TaxID=2829596 RepID=UPI0021061D33|nr:serine hydrolase domain-containing protein [Kordiimonas sp. SCSIO 12603]UTW60333.1 beta-lactamase family protein [Kordiimonas sp. SCSIO 12603]
MSMFSKRFKKAGKTVVGAVLAASMLSSGQVLAVSNLDKLEQNLRPRYTVGSEMPRFNLAERMKHYGVPGVAIAIIKDGKLHEAKGFGVLQAGNDTPVDGDTLFSVGSVSKVVTAALIHRMQDEGKLNVDRDVNDFLKTWKLPDDRKWDDGKINLRMILSHTAGFNVHGFPDFLPGEELPTVYDTLNGTAPARTDALRQVYQPGSRYRYSGGGYTLAQLLVSDVSDKSFEDTAKGTLLAPLGMNRSSFENPLPETVPNVAKAHNRNGEAVALPRGYEAMPEMAASGFWTSANELGTLVAALIESYRTNEGFLKQATAVDMMTKVATSVHGMGPRLQGSGLKRVFHHGGANDSYRAWIEGNLATGDGLVVLTNGSGGNNLYVEIRNAAADTYDWVINEPVLIPEIKLPEAMMASYTGKFKPSEEFTKLHRENLIDYFYDMPLIISAENGKLMVGREGSDRKSELVPTAGNRFMVPALNGRMGTAELIFHRDGHKNIVGMTLSNDGKRSYYDYVSE